MAVSVYIPTSSVKISLFSTVSPAFIICKFFDNGHLTSVRCYLIAIF